MLLKGRHLLNCRSVAYKVAFAVLRRVERRRGKTRLCYSHVIEEVSNHYDDQGLCKVN